MASFGWSGRGGGFCTKGNSLVWYVRATLAVEVEGVVVYLPLGIKGNVTSEVEVSAWGVWCTCTVRGSVPAGEAVAGFG